MLRITITLLLFSNFIYSQEFQHVYGGEGMEHFMSLKQLDNESYVGIGTVMSFGPGSLNLLVSCVNSMGDEVWTKALGDQNQSEGQDLELDADGNLIITGYYRDLETNNADVLVIKMSPQGDVLWSKHYGGSGTDGGKSIDVMSDGSLLVTAVSNSYSSNGDYDFVVFKISDMGEVLWTRSFGTAQYENALKGIELTNGNIAVFGHSDNDNSSAYDVVLAMLDAQGEFLWGKSYGEAGDEIAWSMLEHNGALYMSGDTDSMGAGFADPYILKADYDGNLEWQYTFGGPQSDHATSLMVSKEGMLVAAGLTATGSVGGLDMMAFKFSPDGDLLWSKSYGESEKDVLFDGITTADGGYLLAGYTRSWEAEVSDIYLVKANERGDCLCHSNADVGLQRIAGTYTTNDFQCYNGSPAIEPVNVELESASESTLVDKVLCSHGLVNPASQVPSPVSYTSNDSVNAAQVRSDVNIYPNPTAGFVSIGVDLSQVEMATLVVYGIDGQIIFEDIVINSTQNFELDLSNVPTGVYHVRLHADGQIVDKRLILQ